MNRTDAHAEQLRAQLAPRHKPQQDRSRLRFQALLDAAEEVIAESGLQGLTMREVARRANLPIASVYHYFPSTTGLVRAVVERQFEKMNGILEAGLQSRFPVDSTNFDVEQVKFLIDDIAHFFFNTPSAPEISAGLHAYPDLRALNTEDTKKNAALLQPILARFLTALEPGQANTIAIVLVEWVSATIRFATASPPEVRVQLVEALKTLVAQALKGLTGMEAGTGAASSNPLPAQVGVPLPVQGAKRTGNPPSRAGKKRPQKKS